MNLDEYLQRVYFGDTLYSWLIALAIFIGGTAILLALKAVIITRLGAVARRSPNHVDDLVVDIVSRTRLVVIVIVMAFVAVNMLIDAPSGVAGPTPTVADPKLGIYAFLRFLAVVALVFQGMSWGNGITSFWTEHYAARRGLTTGASAAAVVAFVFLTRVALFLFLLLTALATLGVKIWPLVTGLGIGGIAIALAVQNILGDLFAALSIALDKPFVVGDSIQIDTHSGTVEHIGLKTTRIRGVNGEQIVIGNNDLLKARINNFQRMVERRAVFVLRVTYETTADQLQRIPTIVHDAVMRQKLTRYDRCHFFRYGESSLDFEVVYWMLTADYNTYMNAQQAINLEIFTTFATEGIRFAFPTRTVHLHGGTTASVGIGGP